MDKVVKIDNEYIFIGRSDGRLLKIRRNQFTNKPNLGDVVELFENEDEIVVTVIKQYGEKQENKVNKVIYLLLTIFLGTLGIHKFYAKHYVKGILYLLFAWTIIPFLLNIIEFFVVFYKDSDKYGNIYV